MGNRKFTKEELGDIENKYILEIVDQSPFEKGNSADTIIHIKTRNDKNFVVKMYEPYFPRELVEFHTKISNYLNYDKLPTPRIFQNKESKLVSTYKNKHYILMDFLQGEHPRINDEMVYEIVFSTLAKVHKSLAKFKTKIYTQEIYTISLNQQLKELRKLLPKKAKSSVDDYILNYQEKLSKLVPLVEEKIINIKIPNQLIIGDFNLETLLTLNGEVTGILDFDFVHKNRKIYDIIHTADLFCIDKEKENIELFKRVDWNKLQKCMKEYSKEDKDILGQIKIAPLMLQHKGLSDIIRVWKKGYDPKSSDKEKNYFNRRINFFVNRVEIAVQYEKEIIKHLEEGYKQSL